MNILTMVCVALIVGMGAMQYSYGKNRKKISNQLIDLVQTKQYSKLYSLQNDSNVIRYIPEFNRYYLCMNAALIENNSPRINEFFDKLTSIKLNNQQKKIVFMKGLQYFVACRDVTRCQVCYDNLITMDMDTNSKVYLSYIESIVIKKQTDKFDELLNAVKNNEDNEKFIDEYLIAEIYRNKGDIDESNKFSELAKKHLDEYIKESSN